jgi:hypothetical protein
MLNCSYIAACHRKATGKYLKSGWHSYFISYGTRILTSILTIILLTEICRNFHQFFEANARIQSRNSSRRSPFEPSFTNQSTIHDSCSSEHRYMYLYNDLISYAAHRFILDITTVTEKYQRNILMVSC